MQEAKHSLTIIYIYIYILKLYGVMLGTLESTRLLL